MKNQEGIKQLIPKCRTHSSLIKLPGQPYEEKAISHEEVKWKRNTMVFGVNFNCTRSCFKSEVYMFIRVRLGYMYWESSMIELPFRSKFFFQSIYLIHDVSGLTYFSGSEKRKQDQVAFYELSATAKKQLLQTPQMYPVTISQPAENSLLSQMVQHSSVEEQIDLQRRILAHLQSMQSSEINQPIANHAKQPQNDLFAPAMQELWHSSVHGPSHNSTNSTLSNSTEIQWFPDNLPTEELL